MTGTGISYGAISVLNAIPCGIGSTIGVDLRTEAIFEPADSTVIDLIGRPGMDTTLVETCVKRTLEAIGEKPISYHLAVRTDIPPSKGLKSSSSVCNAVICSVLDHFRVPMGNQDIIRLGVECAKECKVTITGAFDDACGCHLGGLVITNNTECSLLRRESVPWYDVVIVNPDKEIPKSRVNVSKYHELRAEYEHLAHEIINDPFKVLTENGRYVASIIGMDDSVCREALEMGAVAAGVTGTGPAIAIVCEQAKTDEIANRFKNTIICRVR